MHASILMLGSLPRALNFSGKAKAGEALRVRGDIVIKDDCAAVRGVVKFRVCG